MKVELIIPSGSSKLLFEHAHVWTTQFHPLILAYDFFVLFSHRQSKTYIHTYIIRKIVPITGRASSFLEKNMFLKSNLNQIHNFFALLSSSVSRDNMSCEVATIFSSLAFLSSSVSTANLSHLVAALFSNFALQSSSVSTAYLSCLLATSLWFLSNSLSSPRFMRVARRCFLWSSVSGDLFFSSCSFLVLLLALFFSRLLLSLSFLCCSVSEALIALSFSFLSECVLFCCC